jgi:enolase-phosphatase E1
MQIFTNKPKAVIIDMMSTAVKAGFIEKALYRFLRNHGLEVIKQKWGDSEFMESAIAVRRQVRNDAPFNPGMPPVADKKAPLEEQQQSLFDNMVWMIDRSKETDAHYKLKYAIYVDGYEKNRLYTHVYSDVARNAKKWKGQGIQIYLFSHAWIVVQQLFMGKTNHDSLSGLIDGFYDNHTIGPMDQADSFKMLLDRIKLQPSEVIFLTKGVAEGRAAKAAGIHSILVISHRHQMGRYDKNDLQSFERIRSFVSRNDLSASVFHDN